MPAHKKPTPEKYCEHCGKKLERKLLPNGCLEYLIHFNRRKYCNQICFGKANVGQKKAELKWSAAHRRARNICPKGPCSKCGKPDARDVHHKNEDWQDNSPSNLERICRSCHNKEHKRRGSCAVCGKPVKGLGYCEKHYQRYKKWGDPMMYKENQHTPVRRVNN